MFRAYVFYYLKRSYSLRAFVLLIAAALTILLAAGWQERRWNRPLFDVPLDPARPIAFQQTVRSDSPGSCSYTFGVYTGEEKQQSWQEQCLEMQARATAPAPPAMPSLRVLVSERGTPVETQGEFNCVPQLNACVTTTLHAQPGHEYTIYIEGAPPPPAWQSRHPHLSARMIGPSKMDNEDMAFSCYLPAAGLIMLSLPCLGVALYEAGSMWSDAKKARKPQCINRCVL